MYKKPLAILLSVLLLTTSFITLFSFSASAESNNLVADGKFENGFSGWEVFNNTGNASAAYEVVEEGGNHVLKAVPGLSMFKQVTLEAGVEYTVGFDFKFDTNAAVPATYDSFYRAGFANNVAALGGGNFAGPYASGNKYYHIYKNHTNTSTDWQFHTFTYTPASDMTTYFVVGSYNGQGEANFFVDNVFLCKTSDVVEVKTSAGEGGTVPATFKTFKGDNVTLTATPAAGYVVDGWYNANDEKVSDEASYTFIADASAEISAKFEHFNFNMIANGDFAKDNLDDFEVFKNGNNVSSDFVFNANGEKDFYLVGKAGHSLYKQVDLEGGVSYTMSFDFKFASADVPAAYTSFYRAGFVTSVSALGNGNFVGPYASGNKYYSVYTNQTTAPTNWKNHSISFTPAEDMTVYAVVGSYNHDGAVDFNLDNWMLYKTSDKVIVNAAATVGGSVTPTSATAFIGERVTFVATADSGCNFIGWYDGDTLVSSDAEYSFVVSENVSLTAKFQGAAPVDNYIVNGDFEQPFTTDKISDVSITATTGKWGKIYSGVARMEAVETAAFTSVDSAAKNGTRYITSGATKDANQYIRAFGQYVELPAGECVLEFDAKATADLFVASVKKGQYSIDNKNDTIMPIAQSDEWQHYTLNFTVDIGGIYQIAFGGNTQGTGSGDFSIDNVRLAVYVEEETEYIVNGDFEQSFTTDKISDNNISATTGKWGKIYSGVTRMEAVETADFTSVDSAEKNGTRYITSGATKDANQYIRAFGQYVDLPAGVYILEFDAKSTKGSTFVAAVKKGQYSININNELAYKYLDESAEWRHYSILFTADEAGIYQIAFGGNTQGIGSGDFSIDNVSLKDGRNYVEVIVTTDDGGNVTGPDGAVIKGTSVTVVATPKENFVFAGWYNGDQIVSNTASYTFEAVASVTLNAVFSADFSDGTGIIKNGQFDTSTEDWTVVKTSDGSSVAIVTDPETGSNVAQTSGNGGIAFIQQINLKGGTEYIISFDIKFDDFDSIPSTYSSFYRSGFINDPNGNLGNANFVGPYPSGNRYVPIFNIVRTTEDVNGWNKISYEYTPADDMMTWFVIGAFNNQGVSDYAIDNVSILSKNTGIFDYESNILYGEDSFNYVKNPSFENATTDADWGKTLPAGWSIKNEGEKGTNYLSVSGNQSKTYSFKVHAGLVYMVAFSLKTTTNGTSSVSVVDDNGNPLGDAFSVDDRKAVFAPTADGKWHRMGAHFYFEPNESGYAYINIKISAGTNTLDIDDICITRLGFATHEENFDFTIEDNFDFDNPPAWYNPLKFYALDDTTGSVIGGDGDSLSPSTGDTSDVLMIVLMLLLPCALVMVLTAKRTKKIKEEVADNE